MPRILGVCSCVVPEMIPEVVTEGPGVCGAVWVLEEVPLDVMHILYRCITRLTLFNMFNIQHSTFNMPKQAHRPYRPKVKPGWAEKVIGSNLPIFHIPHRQILSHFIELFS